MYNENTDEYTIEILTAMYIGFGFDRQEIPISPTVSILARDILSQDYEVNSFDWEEFHGLVLDRIIYSGFDKKLANEKLTCLSSELLIEVLNIRQCDFTIANDRIIMLMQFCITQWLWPESLSTNLRLQYLLDLLKLCFEREQDKTKDSHYLIWLLLARMVLYFKLGQLIDVKQVFIAVENLFHKTTDSNDIDNLYKAYCEVLVRGTLLCMTNKNFFLTLPLIRYEKMLSCYVAVVRWCEILMFLAKNEVGSIKILLDKLLESELDFLNVIWEQKKLDRKGFNDTDTNLKYLSPLYYILYCLLDLLNLNEAEESAALILQTLPASAERDCTYIVFVECLLKFNKPNEAIYFFDQNLRFINTSLSKDIWFCSVKEKIDALKLGATDHLERKRKASGSAVFFAEKCESTEPPAKKQRLDDSLEHSKTIENSEEQTKKLEVLLANPSDDSYMIGGNNSL